MLKKLATAKAILIMIANTSSADTGTVPQEAIAQAVRYSSSLSCYSESEDEGLFSSTVGIILEDNTNLEESDWKKKYLLMVPSSVACLGGTGTSGFLAVTVVEGFSPYEFYVLPELSGPAINLNGINNRSITSVHSIDAETIEVEWLDYSENDANCCPSITKTTILSIDERGDWNLR